ncbi:glycoside hydrolase family 2 protein [Chitinophaga filiformis]|uniref:Glycosyl hydrolases family 2, TIM barrel domain n=1 Tax=Chitinophaga filiformis TaxID=104663 RepID=A0A1G7HNR7_CHIFI|nr:sugar-binding domain-containing protein [Chitinophaga filiformis]SDF02018.1 Glycosyl hydrolases family 2, TIM barrel domain [Chitinophaga filiformis]
MNKLNVAAAAIALLCASHGYIYAQAPINSQSSWQMQPVSIQTRWAKDVNPQNVLPEYPRPQMVRNEWQNLNGLWQYAITPKDAAKPTQFDGQILVPFPLESALSGVKKALQPTQRLWYKRTITKPDITGDKRVLLHFGAVDWQATVYINGKEIGGHTGGYQNFSFDITNALKDGNNELEVSVFDPTDQGINPHGKQVLNPQNIMYTASSGIWQTVWMETVPAAYINNIRITPDIDKGNLKLEVITAGKEGDYSVEATASNGKKVKGKPNTQLLLPVPNAKLWSPDQPYLYNLNVKLLYKGKVVDTIGSYFGMRKIEVKKDEKGVGRLFLNNKYTYHLGVLDQGFWPEGLYTAPTDEALKFDIMAIRNMGFNTIRKHIKLEPARWYYHADRAGMLVWQDMVTCANNKPEARNEFEKENKEIIAQLYNYPSIVTWVLFNEGWERYDQQRLTEWMKETDPSRIVNGHTGENYDRGAPSEPSQKWASSDLTDIHDYPGPGIPPALPGKAQVLGEWGGVRVATLKHQWNDMEGWGYITVPAGAFKAKYDSMVKSLKALEEKGLSGSIYTEPFDVETEENGMMTYDREVIKIADEDLRKIHSQILAQAENYAATPGVFHAKVADTANPDLQYASLLQQFHNGKKDPEFVRDLTLMAIRVNDKKSIPELSTAYINSMSDPFTFRNMTFIQRFTRSTKDPGFDIMFKNQQKAGELIGDNNVRDKIMSAIFNGEIKASVTGANATPDWNEMEKKIVPQYGSPGEEILLRSKAIHFINNKDWHNFVPAASSLIEKYRSGVSNDMLNNFAWAVFENVSDTTALKSALLWSKYSLEEKQEPIMMDTYANLLHKLGNQQEAIKWEQKALDAQPQEGAFKEALEKMKKGEKTWN